MKKLFFLFLAGAFFYGCSNQGSAPATETKPADSAKSEAKAETPPAAPITYAYPIQYSADFSIGDLQNSKKVLELWKDYDDNNLSNHLNYFADTVMFDFANGMHIKASRDSLMKVASATRSKLASSTSTVIAATCLKPAGKDESWVMIWGKEVDGLKNAKKDSADLHEAWMFNKEGKVAWVIQYSKKFAK